MPTALLLLSEGAEEMEAVIAADVMRRGEITVTVAGLEGKDPVTCSRNVKVVPDVALADVAGQSFDAVVLPGGGKGAQNLAGSAEVGKILQNFEKEGKLIACVCAGPTALISHGIFKGKKVTSHPSVKDQMAQAVKDSKAIVMKKQFLSTGGYKSPVTPPYWANHSAGRGKPSYNQRPNNRGFPRNTGYRQSTGYSYQEERVVVDGNLITSRAPGTSMEFALAIVEHLQGKEKRNSIVPPLVMKE